MRLKNKIALVTGGSRGIGRAICQRMAAEGAKVIVNYRENKQAAHETVETIKKKNGHAFALGGDITKTNEINNVVKEITGRYGGIVVLVNNAGVATFVDFF